MISLKASFPGVYSQLDVKLLDKLIGQIDKALPSFHAKVDAEAFRHSECVTSSGVTIPVIHNGHKCTVRALNPESDKIKEAALFRALNIVPEQITPFLHDTKTNVFDGNAVENVHLIDRVRNPDYLANKVILRGKTRKRPPL